MKFEIKNRFTSSILFEGEFGSWKLCVEAAIKSKANLSWANLSWADLREANLSKANLRWADLSEANLSWADLREANLSWADLRWADLREANLSKANLREADLREADLREADLSGADLSKASLSGADLREANLREADLSPVRDDIWAVLSAAPKEVPALLEAIKAGKIDGSCYEGSCACLVGTIANTRGATIHELDTLEPNSRRPAERFFLGISPGDTPDKNPVAKLAAQWVEEWLENMKGAFSQ